MSANPPPPSGKAGKIYDPVFLCMLAAVVLAVVSSILVRAVSGGAHSARASDSGLMPGERPAEHVADPEQ